MVCPFINSNDPRCAAKLKLDRIDYAISVCADDFTQCPIFWEKVARKRDESRAQKSAAPTA